MSTHPYPGAKFWLCGVGTRRKLVVKNNGVFDAFTQECLHPFSAGKLSFLTGELAVDIEYSEGTARVWENEDGVFFQDKSSDVRQLAQDASGSFQPKFPRFENHPHASELRPLAHEIAVNITQAGPLPNLWVYDKPWHRDAAMMALVLERSENLPLLEPWLSRVDSPFDLNNKGHREPDNLGQMLVIMALLEQPHHPLRAKILQVVPEFHKDNYIEGISDYAPRPVYQTKWLKWGLQKLGLDDPYQIPVVFDEYSSLFWMDYKNKHVDGPRFDVESSARYPYLRWAEAHFYGEAPPLELAVQDETLPLSWEAHASEANYANLNSLLPELETLRCAAPHTWHGAEMFLYWFHNQ